MLETEFYNKCWNCCLNQSSLNSHIHPHRFFYLYTALKFVLKLSNSGLKILGTRGNERSLILVHYLCLYLFHCTVHVLLTCFPQIKLILFNGLMRLLLQIICNFTNDDTWQTCHWSVLSVLLVQLSHHGHVFFMLLHEKLNLSVPTCSMKCHFQLFICLYKSVKRYILLKKK